MILLHDVVEVLHLPEHDGGAVLPVIALDGGCMRLAAIDGNRLRDPIPADRLLQKA